MESSEPIEQRAAEWLSRRDSDSWNERDEADLEHWLEESTAHQVAYLRLETAWRRADRFQSLGAGFPPGQVPTPDQFNLSPFFREPSATGPPPVKTHRKLVLVATTSVLALLVATLAYLWPSGPNFRTPVGATASVAMPDGSAVTLNTDSAIRLQLTPHQRQVRLDRGEAFFAVAKDPDRPFVVLAGDKRVTAVGTQFSVRRIGPDIRVLVTEGAVRIDELPPLTSRVTSPLTSRQPESLSSVAAGNLASTQGDAILVQPKPLSEAEASLSWRSGYLIFHEDTLNDAVAEFNRYTGRPIVIQDAAVGSIRLSGKFRTTECEAFIRILEGGFSIHAERTDHEIILTASPPHR